jgi:hypothetical protein
VPKVKEIEELPKGHMNFAMAKLRQKKKIKTKVHNATQKGKGRSKGKNLHL